jgi:hypothetical protein
MHQALCRPSSCGWWKRRAERQRRPPPAPGPSRFNGRTIHMLRDHGPHNVRHWATLPLPLGVTRSCRCNGKRVSQRPACTIEPPHANRFARGARRSSCRCTSLDIRMRSESPEKAALEQTSVRWRTVGDEFTDSIIVGARSWGYLWSINCGAAHIFNVEIGVHDMDRLSKNHRPSAHLPSPPDCPECSRPMLQRWALPEGGGELFVCDSCGRVKTRTHDWADPGANLRVDDARLVRDRVSNSYNC